MTQILPSSFGFDEGTGPSWGLYFCLYFNCRVRSSEWELGMLSDGFSALSANQGLSDRTAHPVPVSSSLGLTNRSRARGFLTSRNFTASQEAKVEMQVGVVTGNFTTPLLRKQGVIVRAFDASTNTTQGIPAFGWISASCYTLEIGANPGDDAGDVDYQVVRNTLGVATVLDSGTFYAPNPQAAYSIRLRATTVGTDVDLDWGVGGFGMAGEITDSVTDSSPPANFLGVGRAGFFLPCARIETSPAIDVSCANLVKAFQVKESDQIAWRDEWERVNPTACYDLDGLDQFTPTTDGVSMQSAFAWDQSTVSPNVGSPTTFVSDPSFAGVGSAIRRGAIIGAGQTDKITLRKDSADFAQFFCMIAQRPPTDRKSQHRSVKIDHIAAPTSSSYQAGIILRASQPAPFTAPLGNELLQFSGYRFVCDTTSTVATWRIDRFVSGNITQIATPLSETIASATYFPGFGTEYTMEAEVYEVANALSGLSSGSVDLILKVDGVVVPFTNALASGAVRDTGFNYVKEGGEGIYYSNSATVFAPGDVSFDDWSELELTNQVGDDPEGQATITVHSEQGQWSDNPFGSLNLILSNSFRFDVKELNEPTQIPMENGRTALYVNAVNGDLSPLSRKEWTFRNPAPTAAEYDALMTFVTNHVGPQAPFYWRPEPGGPEYVCIMPEGTVEAVAAFVDRVPLEFKVLQLV